MSINKRLNYETQKYIVNKIGEEAFKNINCVKTNEFAEKSEVLVFDEKAFAQSSIESYLILHVEAVH